MALSHNFSTQISNLEKLKEIAARCGFVQTRGAQKGEGSIRQMLEALIEGKAVVKPWCESDRLTKTEKQDLEFQQKLLAQGLIHEIKLPNRQGLSPYNPVTVEGEPVSQMIIRERR